MNINALTAILGIIFGGGMATVILAFFRGTDVWRSGTQRSEARAIQNVERYAKAADRRAAEAEKRSDYRQDLVDFWRGVAADRAYVITTTLGKEALPALPPLPTPPVEIPESAADTKLLDEARHDD
ncbi:MAG TPA: hypothetical protein VHU81_06405 [Thermoanaerobaculia bacterium]|jgi:hypothetical protein|nr:hypothetical protein [Thermoanaerobaculia bacterium]